VSRAASLLLSLCGVAVVGVVVYKVGPPAVADKLAFLGQPPADAPPADPVAAAHARGVAFLLKHQSDDGAWRSDVYALFKDGTALTPLVLCALQDAGGEESAAARRKASDWLAKKAKPDGTIDEGQDGIPYQVYTAALTVTALSHPENKHHLKARDAWLKYLLARQLTEKNGWKDTDKQYGGWGYYPGIPKKPSPGEAVPAQQLLESNLSATVFALDALKAAGVDDPKVLGPARRFVESCQNDDGGFHFIYDDPVRNKAGGDGTYPNGEPRFHSYGSTTADGARALLLCGAKPDDPKVLAARDWLVKHFAADRHPGTYIPTHEPNRNAVYFYYAASVAKTFRMLGVKEVNGRPWAEPLAEALLARQQADGSWANPVELVRENDPVLATAYTVSALAECRKAPK
jgi:squalene-hopene/tetraprenyl-beta-curcumene cyclase